MAAYATVDDLVARWRPLSTEEQARAGVLLDDAAVRIDATVATSDPATEQELAARLIVSCDMVKRAMSAGGIGVTSQQETMGPFSTSQQFANPTGDLYLSKSDRKLLGRGRQRAGIVDLTPVSEES
jgi:hypothetical protein